MSCPLSLSNDGDASHRSDADRLIDITSKARAQEWSLAWEKLTDVYYKHLLPACEASAVQGGDCYVFNMHDHGLGTRHVDIVIECAERDGFGVALSYQNGANTPIVVIYWKRTSS